MIPGKRLKEEIRLSDMKQLFAAELLGISRQTLSTWCSKEMLNEIEIKLVKEKLGIDLSKYDTAIKLPRHGKEPDGVNINNQNKGVPYYELDVTGTIIETFADSPEKPEFFIDFKPFNDCVAYFPIYGDSMFPKYQSGEIVAVKPMLNLNVLLWGEAYLVITSAEANNLRTIKLLFPHKDENKIILRGSNPNFNGDTVVDKENIRAIYIIKGKISKNML